MSKELVEVVRCKDCIHRPIKDSEEIHNVCPPLDNHRYEDYTCPCLNEDDGWYSWCPSDEWFCAEGKAKGDTDGVHET